MYDLSCTHRDVEEGLHLSVATALEDSQRLRRGQEDHMLKRGLRR